MPIYRVQGPDGKIHRFEGPEGASPADIEAAASQQFGSPSPAPAQEQAPVPQQQLAANTMADSQARGLPPLEMPNALGIMRPAPVNAPPLAQQWQEVKGALGSMAKGAPIGLAQGVPGIAGDVESFGRALLSPLGVDRENKMFPTGTRLGEMVAGPPSNQIEADTRNLFSFLSPGAYAKGAKGLAKASSFLTKHALGLTTGAGAPAISEAFQAGKQGGQAATTFLEHMRGGSTVSDDAVRMAKDAVEEMRIERSAAYKSGIGSTIKGDPAVLDFKPIDDAVRNVAKVGVYKGKTLSSGADKAWKKIEEVVDDWRTSDPVEFHTPEGLDALKQRVGNIAKDENILPHTPGAVIVDRVYGTIKDQIVKQAPGYGKVMKDYMEASKEIREIETSLSLGTKASADTSLRKLQSILRNNANTNYGARVKSGEALAEKSPDLMPALAGQALNSFTPRGIQGALAGGGGLAGTAAALGGAMNPALLGSLVAASPRLVGEAAHGLGKLRGLLPNANQAAVLPGGGAGIPSIAGMDPRLLAMMSPQLLAQLLAAQSPARQ